MICIIALVVCGILGIFSAKYRVIAKEAFDCVFRRVTLRRCASGLDKRLKSQITGTLMRKNPKVGRFIYNYFEAISWFFTILLIASLIQSGISVYNFIEYGNCNGKGSDEFCIFDPLHTRNTNGLLVTGDEFSQCGVPEGEINDKVLIAPDIGESATFGNPSSGINVIEFGCYSCQYTKEAEYAYDKIRENYADEIQFVYKNFPIINHPGSYEASIAAECVRKQDVNEFWKYHEILMAYEDTFNEEALKSLASGLDIDQLTFSICLENQETKDIVDNDIQSGHDSGIYGTPTIFINKEAVVGPKSYKEVKKIIENQMD